jgi:S-adenosylmethionine:tRNA-ribosyltransferase-isomerase (queuine synthetase)
MGHDTGVSKPYYKPTEREILEDYLKAQDLLIINADKIILQKQVRVKRKSKDHEYIIKGKLHEKDMQIEALTKKQQEMESKFQQILEKIDTGSLS